MTRIEVATTRKCFFAFLLSFATHEGLSTTRIDAKPLSQECREHIHVVDEESGQQATQVLSFDFLLFVVRHAESYRRKVEAKSCWKGADARPCLRKATLSVR